MSWYSRISSSSRKSLVSDVSSSCKLQAKVHITKGEEKELFELLVRRKVCTWVKSTDVLTIGRQKVLNGMFAVGKGSFLPSGGEIQRLIMNLIPTNAVFRQALGATSDLPSITQYLSLVLYGGEELRLFQSDMSSAFYLFKIPSKWSRMMCFNMSFRGCELGMMDTPEEVYYPACAVIPMGWSSAVSIMQEIAETLTVIGKLPRAHQVKRTAPIPNWLVTTLDESSASNRSWYHVYLDNFCSMEKVSEGSWVPEEGNSLHHNLEQAWPSVGVLSAAKKRVSEAKVAQELGAQVDGTGGLLGPSQERLLKLLQTTMVVISKGRLKKKWVQVVAGRWVRILSFRRPGMIFLDEVWKYISGKTTSTQHEAKVRSELRGCC